ncbi:MAG TPA: hypothetical protein PLI34_05905 [Saprospiraceae bacterium]|nr:hypothetical protein [Saprospiraceae bacterium]
MIIGIPKEIKPQENRVGCIPSNVRQLVEHGHKVLVQRSAGEGSGISDQEYIEAGGILVDDAAAVWGDKRFFVSRWVWRGCDKQN